MSAGRTAYREWQLHGYPPTGADWRDADSPKGPQRNAYHRVKTGSGTVAEFDAQGGDGFRRIGSRHGAGGAHCAEKKNDRENPDKDAGNRTLAVSANTLFRSAT
jgi:hypothetical protein